VNLGWKSEAGGWKYITHYKNFHLPTSIFPPLTINFFKQMKTTDNILIIDLEATCWNDRPPRGQESEIIEFA